MSELEEVDVSEIEPFKTLSEHADCRWEQVGPCVYCSDHDLRLYNGALPDEKRAVPLCEVHDWDEEMGLGFYFQCKRCGFVEWPED